MTTHILPNMYAINMDPDLWVNPEEFNPERFLLNGSVHKPDHFIPFSVGKLFENEHSLFARANYSQFDQVVECVLVMC